MGGVWSNSGAHDVYIFNNHVHDIGRRCTASNFGQAGAYQGAGTSRHTYDGNVFHHIGRFDCGNLFDYNHDHGIYTRGLHVKIINNLFYETRSGWGVQLESQADFVDIAGNTFCGANPKRDGQIVIVGYGKTLNIWNNTSVNARNSFIRLINAGSGNIVLRNNLICGVPHLETHRGSAPALAASGNIILRDCGQDSTPPSALTDKKKLCPSGLAERRDGRP